MQVIKRDGNKENYLESKVYVSLLLSSHDFNFSNEIAKQVTQQFQTMECVESQAIEAIILEQLTEKGCNEYLVAKKKKQEIRQEMMDVEVAMGRLMNQDQRIVNENANKNSKVFNTQRDLTAGTLSRAMGLKLLPPAVAKAHIRGDIHFHDLDYSPMTSMTNCCLIDVEHMLKDGFTLGNAMLTSPQSIETATAQIAQIIANVSSCQYGGCSIDRIDTVLSPYAQKNYDKHLNEAKQWMSEENIEDYAYQRTVKDIYDAMQSLEYEVNTLFTANGQTPFTSIGFGLGTDVWSREIQKAILKVRRQGLGKDKRTAIFPKLIFTLKRGINLESKDPNYDIKQLALQCSTERMYPDVLSYDKIVEITGSFKAPMGCRSFLQGWKDEENHEVNSGRMNLGVITLNLPRIAMESAGNKERFFELLNDRLTIVKEGLSYRVARCKESRPENAPILYMNGAFGHRLTEEEDVDTLFNHERATVSIGYIGLYEVATVFYGPNWEKNKEAKDFTLEVLAHLSHTAEKWSNETGYHYSVYATPSESLTDRFCQLDTKLLGSFKHLTAKGYYTNSFHYDIRKNPTPFEKLEFEKDYAPYTSGGFIHYCEYPVLKQNPKALEAVWDFAYDRVGYLGTNTPIDHCYECGFEGEFEPTERGFKCPECGNTNPETCDVVKRTCGYLGNPQARPMVKGRHEEIIHRVKHEGDYHGVEE